MTDPRCKQCRRAGEKLFLKGERCYTPKCAMIKKAYPPGVHGRSRRRRRSLSEYGQQLKEKQKIRKTYGILERQFRKYITLASQQKGDSRENLMRLLETRLDNIIFRLGLAKSRNQARQLVNHRQVIIGKKAVNIPSYQVKVGQEVALKDKIKKTALMEELKIALKNYQSPAWLTLDKKKLAGKMTGLPSADDFGNFEAVGRILEYYSR